jgi:hypothetical protein
MSTSEGINGKAMLWAGMAIFGALIVSGCVPNEKARVLVSYAQLANVASAYLTDGSSGSATIDGAFILYRINSIQNTREKAASFTLDKKNLRVVTSAGSSGDHEVNLENGMAPVALNNITVGPGKTLAKGGNEGGLGCVVMMAHGNDDHEIGKLRSMGYQVDLLHVINNDQPVTMVRQQGDLTIVHAEGAHPKNLKNLCRDILTP